MEIINIISNTLNTSRFQLDLFGIALSTTVWHLWMRETLEYFKTKACGLTLDYNKLYKTTR